MSGSLGLLRPRVVALLVVGLVTLACEVSADNVVERRSLRGVHGLMVVAEAVPSTIDSFVTDSSLKAYVELKLRARGVQVYGKEEWLKDRSAPTLTVGAVALPIMQGDERLGFTVATQLLFSQAVTLPRGQETVPTISATWTTVGLKIIPDAEEARGKWAEELLGGLVDRFLRAWGDSHSISNGR